MGNKTKFSLLLLISMFASSLHAAWTTTKIAAIQMPANSHSVYFVFKDAFGYSGCPDAFIVKLINSDHPTAATINFDQIYAQAMIAHATDSDVLIHNTGVYGQCLGTNTVEDPYFRFN